MRMTLKRFRHNGPCLLFVAAILCINLIKNVHSVPQQIFIPGLNIANSNSNNHRQQFASQQQQPIAAPQQASSPYQSQKQQPEKKAEFPFNLNDLQINDLFNMLNNPSKSQQQHHQEKSFPAESVFLTETMDPSHVVNMMTTNLDESATLKPFMARPEMLEQHNNDIERYFNKAMSSPYDTISTNDDGLTMTDPSPMSSHSSSSSSSSQDDYDLSTSSTSTTTQTSTTSETTTDETSTTTSSTTTTTETTTTTTTTTTTSTTTTTLAPSSSQRYVTATLAATTRHVAAAAYLGNLKKQDAASSNDYKMKSQMNKLSQMAPMTQQIYASNMNDYLYKKQQQQLNDYSLPNGGRITFNGNLNGGNFDVKSLLAKKDSPQIQQQQQQLPSLVQMSSNYRDCSDNRESKTADEKYCNLFHSCVNGVYQAMLCPEGYLFSSMLQKCDRKMNVECGKRIALDFDRTNIPHDDYMNDYYSAAPSPRIINGSLECTLGLDGYFADPEFCNIYHHCLAGVDYAVQCPQQLVWNDKKKMCDWQTSVNCTGRIIPVAQGQTSFCTDKADNKYADSVYCNVFHHCVGGIDNVVRCDEELQWNDKDKKCDWEGKVHCTNKMLPSEKHYNSTFCIGKPDGPYAHEEYCNVYHVCESGTDNIRQCPNQLFWDYKTKRCDWSGNVECTGRTLITISTDTTLFCMERRDGVYGDPIWCNVYHNCLSGVDFKTKCPAGLIWNETKKDCDWSDSTQCSTGNLLKDSTDVDKITFCTDKPNGKYPHELHCNRYYVCQNGKDIIFTCQNNLRYNATKQECDWAANVNCFGKQDYMWEGIKESFCKNKPDGNYPDSIYCNIFHQCQAATDYPKRCSNRLMFNEDKGECDWEDQVDCKGKEKLIETSGLQDESKPETSGDGKGRVTKFCMVKENGNYADLYYCNVYHNCHGGFDTVQYCANGLVWRQDTPVSGTCDWPLSAKMNNGVDCGNKKTFMIDKQSQVDIMATLRSDFCITRGEGLFAHTKYCDLYIHCTAQAVAITMECSPGLIFNEQKRECDYLSDDQLAMLNNTYCSPPKTVLRPKPKADGTLMFNGNDVTGKFPTKFTCEQKPQQLMYNDDDWCNIYHVCAGPRDNIFICPPGTVFSKEKQGCFDRYTQQSCSGSINYYKPNLKKPSSSQIPSYPGSGGYGSGSSSGGYGSGSGSSSSYGSGSGSSSSYGSMGGGILGGNQIIVVPTPSSPASMGNFEFVYPSSGGSSSGSNYQNSYLQPSYGSNVYSNSGSSSGSSSGGPNPYSSSNQYLHNYNSNYNMGYN